MYTYVLMYRIYIHICTYVHMYTPTSAVGIKNTMYYSSQRKTARNYIRVNIHIYIYMYTLYIYTYVLVYRIYIHMCTPTCAAVTLNTYALF